MIRCPLCETVQPPSPECTVCGKRFTSAPAGGDAPAGTLADMSPTRLPELPQVPVIPIDGLERTALMDAPARTPPPATARAAPAPTGPIPCRYCQHVQATGLLCDRCGMRLPRIKSAVAPEGARTARRREGWGRCSRCRLPGRLAAACTECGADMLGGD